MSNNKTITVRTEVWNRGVSAGELVVKAVVRNPNGTFQGDTNKTAEIPLKKVQSLGRGAGFPFLSTPTDFAEGQIGKSLNLTKPATETYGLSQIFFVNRQTPFTTVIQVTIFFIYFLLVWGCAFQINYARIYI